MYILRERIKHIIDYHTQAVEYFYRHYRKNNHYRYFDNNNRVNFCTNLQKTMQDC